MTTSEQMLLVLLVPELIKDKAVDMLMSETTLSGFSLTKIQGFSAHNSQFNIQEQVEGYKDLYRFEILHDSEQTQALIEQISAFSSSGKCRYWVTPVLYAG